MAWPRGADDLAIVALQAALSHTLRGVGKYLNRVVTPWLAGRRCHRR